MAGETYGRYELVEKVGQGGMAVVYRAFDPVLSRTVALKLLHPHLAERSDSRTRFSREAKAVARLKHTNIVEVFDYAAPESERSYIVTEFIEGPTLKSFADEHPITVPEVAALLILPICEALAKAHSGGIIHRDVKPENIMQRADGSPVLMDFGIAQMIDMPTLTATGTMLGSPAHMAPEVIDGTDIGAAADIFSIGTTLYWLVTGTLPFSAPNPSALFRRILETRYDPVLQRRPAAGRVFARVIESCLLQDANARPTARGLCVQLKEVLDAADLVDPTTELVALTKDPSVYQESLRQRLIPSLMIRAEALVAEKNTAGALDALDRILSYERSHEPALALLAKLDRSRRFGDLIRHVGLAACGIIPICFGVWFYFTTQTAPSNPTPVVPIENPGDLRGASMEGRSQGADQGPADLDSSPLDGPADAAVQDAQPIVDVATPEEDAQRSRRPRRRQRGRSVRRVPQDATPPPAPPPVIKMAKVPFGSKFKRAIVWINGENRGAIAGMQMTPIALPVGEHLVEIRNEPTCKPAKTRLVVRPGKNKKVIFTCSEKRDARIIVRTRTQGARLAVRRAKDNTRLGVTNTVISIPMTKVETRERLTVGEGKQYSEQTVRLKAGEQATITVDR